MFSLLLALLHSLLAGLTLHVPEHSGVSEMFSQPFLPPPLSEETPQPAPAIEDNLQAAGADSDDVIETLIVISVDPVEAVKTAAGAEREDIVEDEGLRLPGLSDHEELGEDGDALQVDGEGPEDLHDAELVVDHQSQEEAGAQQKLHPEGVVVTVVGCLNRKYIF